MSFRDQRQTAERSLLERSAYGGAYGAGGGEVGVYASSAGMRLRQSTSTPIEVRSQSLPPWSASHLHTTAKDLLACQPHHFLKNDQLIYKLTTEVGLKHVCPCRACQSHANASARRL